MFLTKNYILSAELAQKLNINIANFSPWLKQRPDLIGTDIIKLGECMFFKNNIPLLGRSIRLKIPELELTDFSNKVPLTYLKSEYKFDTKYAESKNIGRLVDIAKKKFFEFDADFAYKNRRKTWYLLEKSEYEKEFSDLKAIDSSKKYVIVLY